MNLSAGHIPDSLNRIVEAADDLFAPYGDEADVYVVESILHREIGRMALQARSGAIRPPRPEKGASPACFALRPAGKRARAPPAALIETTAGS